LMVMTAVSSSVVVVSMATIDQPLASRFE